MRAAQRRSVIALLRERVARIDAAIGRRAGGRGLTLLVTRELAVAGITPHAALQAVSVVGGVGLGCRNGRGDQGRERCEGEDGDACRSPLEWVQEGLRTGTFERGTSAQSACSRASPTLCRACLGVRCGRRVRHESMMEQAAVSYVISATVRGRLPPYRGRT